MQSSQWKGIAGCYKCAGTGWKISKKKNNKSKPCKECMKKLGYCPKCAGTGFKIGKPGKVCKCKIIFGGSFFKKF